MISGILDFFQYDFLKMAFIGTIFLGFMTGLISPLIIGKGQALMGPAIAHSTLLSSALAFALIGSTQVAALNLFILIFTIALVAPLAFFNYHQKLSPDALIGVFFSTTMAIGLMLFSLFNLKSSTLMGILFGDILLLSAADLWVLFGCSLLMATTMLPTLKKWIYWAIDPLGAKIAGINERLYHYGLYFLVSLIVVISLKLVGSILVNSFLIIPGIFALNFAKRPKQVFVVSITFAITTGPMALFLANSLGTPAGPTMASFQFFILLFAKAFQKIKGRSI